MQSRVVPALTVFKIRKVYNVENIKNLVQETIVRVKAQALKDARKDAKKKGKDSSSEESVIPNSNQLTRLRVPNVLLSYAVGKAYMQCGQMLTIYGKESVGKTTLGLYLMGQWIKQTGGFGIIMNSEGRAKFLDEDDPRLYQDLDSDKKLAKHMWDNNIIYVDITDLAETWTLMNKIVKKVRTFLPIDKPIIILLDVYNKVMDSGEVEMYDNMSGKSDKSLEQLEGGSNFLFSKTAQKCMRMQSDFLDKSNSFLICTAHQNEKVDTSANPYAKAPECDNTTWRGSRCLVQSCTHMWYLSRMGKVQKETADKNKVVTGKEIALTVTKSSKGKEYRQISYILRIDDMKETEDWIEPSLDFYSPLAKFLERNKYAVQGGGMYRSETFFPDQLTGKSAFDFGREINENIEVRDKVLKTLKVLNFDDSNLVPLKLDEVLVNPEEITVDDEPEEEEAKPKKKSKTKKSKEEDVSKE